MHAFEVYRNGKRLCVAGIGEDGVLNTIVNHVIGNGRNELFMSVGGLDCTTDEHLRWKENFHLKVGDEIRIKIIEAKSVDRPRKRFARDRAGELKSKKLYVRRMAKELGWEISAPRTKSK